MDFLLDTHTIIWFSQNNEKLSKFARELISDINNNCFISIASIWEMAIKLKLKKLSIDLSLNEFVNELSFRDFKFLDLKLEHVINVSDLDLFHKDPFDRIIISQSIIENIPIISIDQQFDKYPIKRIWEGESTVRLN
jgi:PIN domain nuclease of toxin-antitoxin system